MDSCPIAMSSPFLDLIGPLYERDGFLAWPLIRYLRGRPARQKQRWRLPTAATHKFELMIYANTLEAILFQ